MTYQCYKAHHTHRRSCLLLSKACFILTGGRRYNGICDTCYEGRSFQVKVKDTG